MLSDICWHGHLRVLQGGSRLQVMQETPSLAGNRPSETAGVVTTTPPQEGSELQEQARRPWGLVWDHHPPRHLLFIPASPKAVQSPCCCLTCAHLDPCLPLILLASLPRVDL